MSIATGGMATVYIGRQHGAAGFERIIAIKRMHPHIAGSPELVGMFRDEARIASLIHHPNVVTVHDMHEESGELFIIMDYVDGVSLRLLRHARHSAGSLVPRNVALRAVVDTLRGLHAAHEQKGIDGAPLDVVHRDATPHNILIGSDGCVKLTDFGIARATERSSSTAAGHFKGKFAYMAPEQCTGGILDKRVDIFATGVVLWELLTGRHLFHADNDAALVHLIASGKYKRPSEVRRDVPASLEDLVMQALSVFPEARFDTAAEFADALERAALNLGGLATSTQVAAVLMETCGESVQARRHQLHEVLGGRRPKVTWAAPRAAPPSRGSISFVASSSDGSLDSQLIVPEDSVVSLSTFLSDKKRSQRVVWIAACALAAVVLLTLVLVFTFRRSASPQLDAASPSALQLPASTHPPNASASPPPEPLRVAVRIEADQEITEVRVAQGFDVEIQGATATLTAARCETPMLVHVQLADGTVTEETIVPRADMVLRLSRSASPKKPPRAALGTSGPPRTVPTPQVTGVAPSKTAAGKVGPRYEKDPYQ